MDNQNQQMMQEMTRSSLLGYRKIACMNNTLLCSQLARACHNHKNNDNGNNNSKHRGNEFIAPNNDALNDRNMGIQLMQHILLKDCAYDQMM